MKYVAVVFTPDGASRKYDNTFACFVEETREAAIEAALNARDAWSHRGRRYRVVVGALTDEVVTPTNYKIRAFKG
jgi:hypothetical protein